MILVPPHITRTFIQSLRETHIFLYGDTIHHDGNGGQAKSARGEPNAFPIPVKIRKCANDETSFFHDSDPCIEVFRTQISSSLLAAAESWKLCIAFPKLGKGYNYMDEKAPKLREWMLSEIRHVIGSKLVNAEVLI